MMNILLWILQVLLALFFLFAGVMKFVTPAAQLEAQSGMPAAFLWFIGACEILGGLGLILPSLLRIKPWLMPLAALGLVIIMIGATVVSLKAGLAALFPFVTGLLLAFVAYGRWRIAPIQGK
jgi:uncharacterized membrane protein YphA (DoxX/SURF4 family)